MLDLQDFVGGVNPCKTNIECQNYKVFRDLFGGFESSVRRLLMRDGGETAAKKMCFFLKKTGKKAVCVLHYSITTIDFTGKRRKKH